MIKEILDKGELNVTELFHFAEVTTAVPVINAADISDIEEPWYLK